jgi:uncharacterized RDD family membrane protein YckC
MVSRSIAFAIDMFVMAFACVVGTYFIAWTVGFFRLGTFAIGHRLVDFGSRAVVIAVMVFYLPLCWTLTGQSVGKAILGLRVVRHDAQNPSVTRVSLPRSFLRAAGYWLSALPLGLGFLWAAFDEDHRTLHDRLAGTRVVYDSTKRR